jgi:enoyl-CoA hydratase
MIEVSSTGDVAIVRLAHGKANAMSIELCEELTKRLKAVNASSARATIIVGSGRMFSAGVDLPYVREFLPALCTMFATVFTHPKPIVAAVNGHAIAGGCVLACACDKRLMARDAGRIGVTELLVGVPFPAIAMEIMRGAAAPQHFENLLFGGATYTPEEASGLGLVDEVVAPDALLERAVAAAQTLAALSPSAFALTKRQTRQPALERLQRDGTEAEVTQIWTAPETLERIRDYVSRTFKKV